MRGPLTRGPGAPIYGALAGEAAGLGGMAPVVVVLLLVVDESVVLGVVVPLGVVVVLGVVVSLGAVVVLGVVVVVVVLVVSSFLPQAEKASAALSAATMVLKRIRVVCMRKCSC